MSQIHPTDLRVATAEAYVLAEGPFWDAARSRLLWVDIERGLSRAGDRDSR